MNSVFMQINLFVKYIMSTLSLTKGKTLARIKGGKLNNTIVYLYDPDFKCCSSCSSKCVNKKCCAKCSLYTYHFSDAALELEDENEIIKAIIPRGEKFQQIASNLPFTQPDLLYVSGRRGSGKSYYIAEYLQEFIKMYPTFRIYMFSGKAKDELLDKYLSKRIDITKIKEAGFVAADFEKSLVIFDDIDCLDESKENNVKKAVYDLMNDIIETGRSLSVFCIVTSHIASNHGESKRILNGCSSFTFFLASSSHQTEYTLKNYFGFSPKQIRKILAIDDSRWCTVFRDIPQIVMTQTKIMFQSQIEEKL